jgi:hypothetical protein
MHTFAGLNLKEPDRDIYSNAQWSASLLKMLDSNLGEGYSLARSDFLVDAGKD